MMVEELAGGDGAEWGNKEDDAQPKPSILATV
jgi:hypothetical protein